METETTTNEDKLIFFGVTFASLAALTSIISHVNPSKEIHLGWIFLFPLLISLLFTLIKFDLKKVSRELSYFRHYLQYFGKPKMDKIR